MNKTDPENKKIPPGHGIRSALIFRNTLSRASSATFAQVLALATIPLLLDKVSAAEFGVYTIGAAFVGYFSLLSMPARQATLKFVAEYGDSNKVKIREFASSTILVNFCVGIVMGLILVIIAHFSHVLFVIEDELLDKTKLILYTYAFVAPISQPLSVFGSVLLGLQDYRPSSILDVLGAIVRALTILFIFFMDGSILWLVFQELFFEIAKNIILGYLLASRYGVSGFSINLVKISNLRKVLGYGGWSIGYVLSTMLIYQGTRVLVGVFVSVAAIAYFQIAYMLYNVVNSVSRYLQSAVIPASSSAIVASDHAFIQKLLFKGTRASLCVILPLVLSIVMLADPVLRHWISPEYSNEATSVSQVLVSAWLFQAWVMTTIDVYRGQGDIRAMSILVLFGALGQITLAIVLMKIYGVVGAAVSTIIYYMVITPLQVLIAARKIGFSIVSFMIKSVIPIYVVTAIMTLLFYAAIHYIGKPANAVQTILSLMTAFSFMVIVLFTSVARDEGRTIFSKLLSVYRSLTGRKPVS